VFSLFRYQFFLQVKRDILHGRYEFVAVLSIHFFYFTLTSRQDGSLFFYVFKNTAGQTVILPFSFLTTKMMSTLMGAK